MAASFRVVALVDRFSVGLVRSAVQMRRRMLRIEPPNAMQVVL
ncbi:hypothetical protein [Paenarthrobacter sp. 4246]